MMPDTHRSRGMSFRCNCLLDSHKQRNIAIGMRRAGSSFAWKAAKILSFKTRLLEWLN
jgi:hypothetical protein